MKVFAIEALRKPPGDYGGSYFLVASDTYDEAISFLEKERSSYNFYPGTYGKNEIPGAEFVLPHPCVLDEFHIYE